MTGGADLDHQVFAERRARREFIAATTGDLDVGVIGVNVGFHVALPSALTGEKAA